MDTADKPAPEPGPQPGPDPEPGSGGEPSPTDDWLLAFAAALADLSRSPTGSTPGSQTGLGHRETGAILHLARDVAHGVERRFAPLATYLTGRFVAERLQQGATVDEALAEAEAVAQRLIGRH